MTVMSEESEGPRAREKGNTFGIMMVDRVCRGDLIHVLSPFQKTLSR